MPIFMYRHNTIYVQFGVNGKGLAFAFCPVFKGGCETGGGGRNQCRIEETNKRRIKRRRRRIGITQREATVRQLCRMQSKRLVATKAEVGRSNGEYWSGAQFVQLKIG